MNSIRWELVGGPLDGRLIDLPPGADRVVLIRTAELPVVSLSGEQIRTVEARIRRGVYLAEIRLLSMGPDDSPRPTSDRLLHYRDHVLLWEGWS